MKIHRNGLVVKKILCDFKPYVLEGKRHKRYKLVAFLAHIGVDILLQIFLVELRLKALFDGVDIGLRAALNLVFEGYVKEKREVAYGFRGEEFAKIDGHSCVDVLVAALALAHLEHNSENDCQHVFGDGCAILFCLLIELGCRGYYVRHYAVARLWQFGNISKVDVPLCVVVLFGINLKTVLDLGCGWQIAVVFALLKSEIALPVLIS